IAFLWEQWHSLTIAWAVRGDPRGASLIDKSRCVGRQMGAWLGDGVGAKSRLDAESKRRLPQSILVPLTKSRWPSAPKGFQALDAMTNASLPQVVLRFRAGGGAASLSQPST